MTTKEQSYAKRYLKNPTDYSAEELRIREIKVALSDAGVMNQELDNVAVQLVSGGIEMNNLSGFVDNVLKIIKSLKLNQKQ